MFGYNKLRKVSIVKTLNKLKMIDKKHSRIKINKAHFLIYLAKYITNAYIQSLIGI